MGIFNSSNWKYWLCAIGLILLALYSVYAVSYFAWVTATPVPIETLEHARKFCKIWMAVLILSILLGIALAVRVYQRRKSCA